MVDNAKPSMNPSNEGSLTGMLKEVFKKFLQGTDDMLPAQVVGFNGDRENPRVSVEALIVIINTEGQIIKRAQIPSIPVFQLGAGGFVMSFNLKAGDLGWIKASDRDISNFVKNYDISKPNTERLHSFSDAVFFPDVMKGYTIDDEDQDNLVIQTLDGSQRIAIWEDKVKITSDTRVIIDAPITEFTGAIINGTNPAYDDYAEFAGNIRARQDVIAQYDVGGGEVSLLHHTHDGVQTGGGNTGEPNGT